MKARIIALSSFIILTSIFAVEAKDRYLKTIDSLLISIDELITNDLLEESIILSKRPWVGLGDSWELKVFFNEKNSLFLTSLSRPDGLIKQKVNRTKLKKYFMLDAFMNHIYKYGELPYDAIAFQSTSLLSQPGFIDLLEFHAYSYQHSLGGLQLNSFTPDVVRGLATQYPTYFNTLGYTNFGWTSLASFIYPF